MTKPRVVFRLPAQLALVLSLVVALSAIDGYLPVGQVAEHPNLVTAETNRAFVLMQYFGYLRRNPNDAPDTDYTGYEFWLNKLNQFGDYRTAEMVKAFLNSTEYRKRFGPPYSLQ